MKHLLRALAGLLTAALLLTGCHPAQALTSSTAPPAPGTARVWFFDVGQGDSELIQTPGGANILIDAGTAECAEDLVAQLNTLQIQKLDAVIATHPHADHIGGMEAVVKAFPIGAYFMPEIADRQVPTLDVYTRLLEALTQRGIKATRAGPGVTAWSESNCTLRFLAPHNTQYQDLNNYSAVAMLTVGSKRFLFTGDAEKESEQEMLQAGDSLRADVLKCGHHSSKTSTTEAFLSAVSPSAAVISCGRGNDYGFPPEETLARLKRHGVTVYRTDAQNTICATTDGKQITFQTGLPKVTDT